MNVVEKLKSLGYVNGTPAAVHESWDAFEGYSEFQRELGGGGHFERSVEFPASKLGDYFNIVALALAEDVVPLQVRDEVLVSFGENAFGDRFCFRRDRTVVWLDGETGAVRPVTESFAAFVAGLRVVG